MGKRDWIHFYNDWFLNIMFTFLLSICTQCFLCITTVDIICAQMYYLSCTHIFFSTPPILFPHSQTWILIVFPKFTWWFTPTDLVSQAKNNLLATDLIPHISAMRSQLFSLNGLKCSFPCFPRFIVNHWACYSQCQPVGGASERWSAASGLCWE